MYKMSPAQYARLTHRERMLAGMSGMASAPNGVESYHSSGAREGTALHSNFRAMVDTVLSAPQIGTVISGGRYQVATAPNELELQTQFAPQRTRGPQSNIYQRAGVARLAGLGAVIGKPLAPRSVSVAKFAPMSLTAGRRGAAEVTPVLAPRDHVPMATTPEVPPRFGPMTVGILRNQQQTTINTGSGGSGGSSSGGGADTSSGGGSSSGGGDTGGGSSGGDTSSGPGPTDMGGQLDANGNPVGETSLTPGPGAGKAAKGVLDTGGPAVPTWAIGLGLVAVAGAAWYFTRK